MRVNFGRLKEKQCSDTGVFLPSETTGYIQNPNTHRCECGCQSWNWKEEGRGVEKLGQENTGSLGVGMKLLGVEGNEGLGGERSISRKYYSGLCCHVRCSEVHVLLLQRIGAQPPAAIGWLWSLWAPNAHTYTHTQTHTYIIVKIIWKYH